MGRYTNILNRRIEPPGEELLHVLARCVPRELNGDLEARLAWAPGHPMDDVIPELLDRQREGQVHQRVERDGDLHNKRLRHMIN